MKVTLFDEPLGLAWGQGDQPGVGERGDCEEDGVEQRGEGEGRAEVRGAGEGQHVAVEGQVGRDEQHDPEEDLLAQRQQPAARRCQPLAPVQRRGGGGGGGGRRVRGGRGA